MSKSDTRIADSTSQKPQAASEKSTAKKWIENIISLALSLLAVFAIRSSVIEAFKIPSGSMIPTLLVGDYIFVNKFSYGLHFPFSEWFTDSPAILIHRDIPKRGDIIVFKFPKNPSIYFIKRVIGRPGDTIELRDKVLYINGQEEKQTPVDPKQESKMLSEIDESHERGADLHIFWEQLGGVKHWIMLDESGQSNFGPQENYGPITVPPNSLFVMGDNRDFSNDSRYWGFVPMANVKGHAMFIWMSLWLDFSDQQFTFHPTRTGTILH